MSSTTPFIEKLRTIVDNGVAVHWSANGTTFTVEDVPKFENQVLRRWFKSPHMASFVRQLNFYGFRKLKVFGRGRARGASRASEFQHPMFLRDNPEAACKIQRRTSADAEATRSETELARQQAAQLRNELGRIRKQLEEARRRLDDAEQAKARLLEENEQLRTKLANRRANSSSSSSSSAAAASPHSRTGSDRKRPRVVKNEEDDDSDFEDEDYIDGADATPLQLATSPAGLPPSNTLSIAPPAWTANADAVFVADTPKVLRGASSAWPQPTRFSSSSSSVVGVQQPQSSTPVLVHLPHDAQLASSSSSALSSFGFSTGFKRTTGPHPASSSSSGLGPTLSDPEAAVVPPTTARFDIVGDDMPDPINAGERPALSLAPLTRTSSARSLLFAGSSNGGGGSDFGEEPAWGVLSSQNGSETPPPLMPTAAAGEVSMLSRSLSRASSTSSLPPLLQRASSGDSDAFSRDPPGSDTASDDAVATAARQVAAMPGSAFNKTLANIALAIVCSKQMQAASSSTSSSSSVSAAATSSLGAASGSAQQQQQPIASESLIAHAHAVLSHLPPSNNNNPASTSGAAAAAAAAAASHRTLSLGQASNAFAQASLFSTPFDHPKPDDAAAVIAAATAMPAQATPTTTTSSSSSSSSSSAASALPPQVANVPAEVLLAALLRIKRVQSFVATAAAGCISTAAAAAAAATAASTASVA